MREQLQKLIHMLKLSHSAAFTPEYREGLQLAIDEIEAILAANPEPVVRLRPGWLCKDYCGTHWFENKPTWHGDWNYTDDMSEWALMASDIGDGLIDPWPNHPNGGPECLMQVYP